MAARKSTEDKAIDAALRLAAKRGWRGLSMADIARAARVPLADLSGAFGSKAAILAAFSRRIDAQVLEGLDEDLLDEPARDRVFDVLMARFDALGPHKPALKAIARDMRRDPLGSLALTPAALQSLGWMLEGAGIDSSGLAGAVRVRGLALIWLATFRVWLDDDEAGLAKTMAELDRRLRQAERVIESMRRSDRDQDAKSDAGPDMVPGDA